MLDGAHKSRLEGLEGRLSELHERFRQNVSNATLAWRKHVGDEGALAGVTAEPLEAARQRAKAAGSGGFLLALDPASYEAVVDHADDRSLRKELYEAYVTRASDRGPLAGRYDNGPLIDEILALRHEQAEVLGFANYAEAALCTKMLPSTEDVDHFLIDLKLKAHPRALAELTDVWKFARSQGAPKEFRPWDVAYWSERLRRHEFGAREADDGFLAGLTTAARLELALFDLRLHRDYVPQGRASSLRSQVLDALAQVRREISVLPPPPWNRMPSHAVDMFGVDGAVGWCASILADVLSASLWSGFEEVRSVTQRAPHS